MFDDFYENLANDIDLGIDDFLENAHTLKMKMTKLSEYTILNETPLGNGTYGVVSKARNNATAESCAIKLLKIDKEVNGFPITALREIKLLQALKHENIVNLKDVCYEMNNKKGNFSMNFHLVFELCHTDLHKVLAEDQNRIEHLIDKKKIMFQLLRGMQYMHRERVMHRDLKPANILINSSGNIKIADFGLSRKMKKAEDAHYTDNVVTLWYRAPEILLRISTYTPAIDIWSLGCIFYELWPRTPLLNGGGEMNQLNLIMKLCGGINNKVWPGIEEIFKCKNLEPRVIDLICKMLSYNPFTRPTAEEALQDKFFLEMPKPDGPTSLRIGARK